MKRTLLATTAAAVLGLSTTLAAAQSTAPDTGAPEKHAQPGTSGKAPGAAAPQGNKGQTMQGHPAGTPNAQMQEPSGAQPKGQQHMNSQLQQQEERNGQPKAQQRVQQGQMQEQRNGQERLNGPSRQQGQLQEQRQKTQQGQLQEQRNGQERLNQPSSRTGSVNQPNRQPSQAAQPSQNAQTRTQQTARASQVQITEQQRTQIHERISQVNLHRVDHADFSVSVGTVVPRTVVVEELPPAIVEIVPEYRGFRYVVVGDELLIVDPASLEIVAVLPA